MSTVTAATVEAASATVEPASATVEAASATMKPAADRTASEPALGPASEAAAIKAASSAKTVSAAYKATSVEAGASIETAMSIESVKPWARPDENAADKIIRAVIAVGSAGVRVIAVVTVGTGRSRPYVSRAHSNADEDSLCASERCRT